MNIECHKHGWVSAYKNGDRLRCKKCNTEAVTKARQKRKFDLVELMGGKCQICGYCKCQQALQFHHVDPSTKSFAIGADGFCRSWEKMLAEAKKCVLLCARCHVEVEYGITIWP